MTKDTTHSLSVARIFDAPPEVIFRAWTEPSVARRWWWPRGFTTLSFTIDVRPGGAWRSDSRSPSGGIQAECGVVQEAVEPRRLVFTLSGEDSTGSRGVETVVTVTFAPHGTATTKVTLTQTGFETATARDANEEGWSSCFDLLSEHLAHAGRRDVASVEEAKIRALVESLAQALREKNRAGVVSHYAPDTVVFDLAPPLVHGARDIPNDLDAWFPTWTGTIGLDVRDLRVVVSDDVAFSTSLQRMHGERTTGERTDVWFRATHAFQKVEGAWLIAHEHLSVPLYMDGSERAALDLAP